MMISIGGCIYNMVGGEDDQHKRDGVSKYISTYDFVKECNTNHDLF